MGRDTAWHRDAVVGEQLLGLVFVEIHETTRVQEEMAEIPIRNGCRRQAAEQYRPPTVMRVTTGDRGNSRRVFWNKASI